MMRGIAVAISVTDHHDPAGVPPQCLGDPCIKVLILRDALATLAQLILVRKMMKGVMRIVWPDCLICLIGGTGIRFRILTDEALANPERETIAKVKQTSSEQPGNDSSRQVSDVSQT